MFRNSLLWDTIATRHDRQARRKKTHRYRVLHNTQHRPAGPQVETLEARHLLATFGSDTFGYLGDDEAPFSFEDISGTPANNLNLGDDTFVQVALPFPFEFYGTTYNDIFVSDNGLLTFGSGVAGTTFKDNQDLTAGGSNVTQPVIAPFWDDLSPVDGGNMDTDNVYAQELGTADLDQRMVIQWHDIRHFAFFTNTFDFQAALLGSGGIEIR